MRGLETNPLPPGWFAGFLTAVILIAMIRFAQWARTNPVVESAVTVATAPMFSIIDVVGAVLLLASFYLAIVYGPRRIRQ